MYSCGSATAWTHWGRFGRPAAGIRWSVTTAAALTDNSSAPITAASPSALGAPGPVGRHAAFPVGRAREPDTGKEKKLTPFLWLWNFTNYHPPFSQIYKFLFLVLYFELVCVSDLLSQRPGEQIAISKKSSVSPAIQGPAHLSVSTTTRNSMWETPGCKESVNNGETHAPKQREIIFG